MDNVKKILVLLWEGVEVGEKMIGGFKDGVSLDDFLVLVDLREEIAALFDVQWKQVPLEWKQSRLEGHATLIAAMKSELSMDDKRAEAYIEAAMEALAHTESAIAAFHRIATMKSN